jgi:nitrogen fixation NifU-like protein
VLHELVQGGKVTVALAEHAAFAELMVGRGTVEPDEEVLGDAVAFAGVSRYPARVKCALLPWMAFKDALARAVADADADAEGAPGADGAGRPVRVAEVKEGVS